MAWWKTALRVLGALVGLSVLVTSVWLLSSHGLMRSVLAWLERLGAWGYVVLAALFVPISTPFGYGYTAIGFTCGALYGVVRGTLVMMVGADGGAIAAFIVIRYLFKDWFRDWLSSKRRLRLLMRAVDLNATKFAFLSRFTPIPWGIQNTIYAVSDIELWKFAVLTSVGGFPDQVIIAFMGSQVQVVLIADGEVGMGTGKWVMVALELLACLALAVLMVVFAKRAIDQTNAEEDNRASLEAAQRAQAEARRIMGCETPAVSVVEVVVNAPAPAEEASEKHSLLEPVEALKRCDSDTNLSVSSASAKSEAEAPEAAETRGQERASVKEVRIEMAPLVAASSASASASAVATKSKGASNADTESPKARLLSDDTADSSAV